MSLNPLQLDSPALSRPAGNSAGGITATSITIVAWLAALGAAMVVLWPLLVIYGRQLWNADHYQFVPVLMVGALWVAWTRWRALPAERTRPNSVLVRMAGWLAACLAVGLAALARSPMLSYAALLVIGLAALYEWRGKEGVRQGGSVLGVLLLAVRPPFGWDQRLILAMQHVATGWSSGVLDLLGIYHLTNGVVVRLPEQQFFVAEACSGVHSLFAALAFVAVYSALTHRGAVRMLCLMAMAVFWVLVANALRILAVVVLTSRFSLPVMEGFGHEALGVGVFALVILTVFSFDRLLLYLVPLRQRLPSLVQADIGDDGPARKTRRWGQPSLATAVAGCVLAMAWGLSELPQRRARAGDPMASTKELVFVPKGVLPLRWNGWERTSFEVRQNEHELRGDFSRIWSYQKGRLTVAISIDGPFTSWHNTAYCYAGLGYDIQHHQDYFPGGPGATEGGFTELLITGRRGREGYVLFMAYTDQGQALSPPISRHASIARLLGIWKKRLLGQAQAPDPRPGRVFQVQLLAQGVFQFTEGEKAELREMFHEMRGRIATYVREARGSPEGTQSS